ncbi:MAG: MBL fold metallo-hydrolase [Elusimicrobiota bacterium]|jgi:glyoxylase-like metal-dependent hydrolase (beta-lactamase superfamily II)
MSGGIYLRQLAVGPMQNFAYLVGSAAGEQCAAVDPGWDGAGLLAAARSDGRRIVAVLLTHDHFDHVGALREILADGGREVWVHASDASSLAGVPGLRPTADGERARVAGLDLEFMHTPGHTPGSQCIAAGGQLFTGDTLFLDCCGRTDLAGSDPARMHASLRRLAALPESTVVWPGHDYGNKPSAALGEIKKINPFLAARTLAEFRALGG